LSIGVGSKLSGESGTYPQIILFILHPDVKKKQKPRTEKNIKQNKNKTVTPPPPPPQKKPNKRLVGIS
jgi:hypothetical protein